MAKIAEIDARTCRHRATETEKVIIYHLTGGGDEIFDLTNFVSRVCPSGELFEFSEKYCE